MKMKILRLLFPRKATSLPLRERMDWKDMPKASLLIYYGGTKITEWIGAQIYDHIYRAPFHAAIYLGDGKVLNVAKKTEIIDIKKQFQSTRRIDAIILNDLTQEQRDEVCQLARNDASKNHYDKIGFVRFAGRFKALRFLKWIKSSEKDDFCSDNCVDNVTLGSGGKVQISYQSSEDTAPWHLIEHAISLPIDIHPIYTIHKGVDFKD